MMRPPTTDAAAAFESIKAGPGVKSKVARSMALDLLDVHRDQRRAFLHTLTERDRTFVFGEVARELGTVYGLWYDAPVGFVEDVLGETMWGLQAAVMDGIADETANVVVVPAGFGVGKTYLGGRMVAWAGAVNQVGTIKIVTTATRWRQVRSQLWPHIKTAVAKGKIHGGSTDTTQWIGLTPDGRRWEIAYGFTAPANDEAAMQGIHGTPKLLLVVDEAGGIAPAIGKGTNNLLTGDARLLAIGNPAMNEPDSWFERLSERGEKDEEIEVLRVQISTLDSPAITGAPTPVCRDCVPNLDGHTISEGVRGKSHLPDWQWLRNTLAEYGVFIDRDERDIEHVRTLINESGHPYLIAKVLAEFPKGSANQIIPTSWVEAAMINEIDTGLRVERAEEEVSPEALDGYVRLNELGLEGETDDYLVKYGSWIRLGVDVAADGGDEFAIYRSVGDVLHKRHASAGSMNADPVIVAEKVLDEIDAAQRLATALGTEAPIRVKVDANGLGWGVVGNLKRWGPDGTGRHQAQIIGVMVSESPEKDDPAAVMRPYRKRDELWLAGRFLMQPDPSTGFGRVRLRVDDQCKKQLSNPKIGNNAAGFTTVERKDQMKARGVNSPDRAEAALLAIYEPFPIHARRSRGVLN